MSGSFFEKIFGCHYTVLNVVGSEDNKKLAEKTLLEKQSVIESFFAMWYDSFNHFSKIHCGERITITTCQQTKTSKFLFIITTILVIGHLIGGVVFKEEYGLLSLYVLFLPFAVIGVVRLFGKIKHQANVRRIVFKFGLESRID